MHRHHSSTADDNFRATDLFAGLSGRELRLVSRCTTEITVPAGRVLWNRGAPARDMVVLESGEAAVTAGDGRVAIMRSGSHLGAEALVPGRRRPHTLIALTEVTVLVMSRSELRQLASEIPMVRARLLAASETEHRVAVAESRPAVLV
jgi:CRP-like cAMP-binding protein